MKMYYVAEVFKKKLSDKESIDEARLISGPYGSHEEAEKKFFLSQLNLKVVCHSVEVFPSNPSEEK